MQLKFRVENYNNKAYVFSSYTDMRTYRFCDHFVQYFASNYDKS